MEGGRGPGTKYLFPPKCFAFVLLACVFVLVLVFVLVFVLVLALVFAHVLVLLYRSIVCCDCSFSVLCLLLCRVIVDRLMLGFVVSGALQFLCLCSRALVCACLDL